MLSIPYILGIKPTNLQQVALPNTILVGLKDIIKKDPTWSQDLKKNPTISGIKVLQRVVMETIKISKWTLI